MQAWNSGTAATVAHPVNIPASSLKYATLTEVTTTTPFYRTFARSDLYADTLATSSTSTAREEAVSTVCWNGSSACSSGNTKYGWLFDLPTSREQIIYDPIFFGGELFVNTSIPPPATTVGQCTPSLPTGWSMGFKMDSGGGAAKNIFTDSSGSLVVSAGHSSIMGTQLNAVGTPYIVSIGSSPFMVSQTSGGPPKVTKINPQGGVTVKMVSWEQLR